MRSNHEIDVASPDDAQAMICSLHHERAMEIQTSLKHNGGDVAMMESATEEMTNHAYVGGKAAPMEATAPALLVAEQISVDDAQQMIYDSYHERALQLEAEELAAKDNFKRVLAQRGGN